MLLENLNKFRLLSINWLYGFKGKNEQAPSTATERSDVSCCEGETQTQMRMCSSDPSNPK